MATASEPCFIIFASAEVLQEIYRGWSRRETPWENKTAQRDGPLLIASNEDNSRARREQKFKTRPESLCS